MTTVEIYQFYMEGLFHIDEAVYRTMSAVWGNEVNHAAYALAADDPEYFLEFNSMFHPTAVY